MNIKVKEKVAFSGKMTSGKSTLSKMLSEKYGYEVLAIGGRIKKVCNLLIEDKNELNRYLSKILPKETLNRDKNPVELTFSSLLALYEQKFQPFIKKYGINYVFIKDGQTGIYQKNEFYRKLTQEVGNCVRGIFGQQIWVEILLNEANLLIAQGKKVICDDVRLGIEYDRFKEQNYIIFRLEVDPEVQRKRIVQMYGTFNEDALTHHTEIELDNYEFEHKFNTSNEDIEDTFKKIEKLII